jgi:dTDP-4-dehydrorhamnose 3,5-epimerase-like enzyme
MSNFPHHSNGFQHCDQRGSLSFNNAASLAEFKRCYVIENTDSMPLRGWHGHKFESKGFVCLNGAVRIGAVQIDNWDKPSSSLEIFSADLVSGGLDFVYLPAGYANAILSLTPGARVMVFSSSTLEESQADDFRFPLDTWRMAPRPNP